MVRGVAMIQVFHDDYVLEILAEAESHRRLSRDEFYKLFRHDISAGFQPEVDEAARRYFTTELSSVYG
jgi:hypothetical protein